MKIDFIAEYNKVKDPVIRQSLIDNYDPEFAEIQNKIYNPILFNNKLQQSMLYGFEWIKSKQGYYYWDNIYDQIRYCTLELIDGAEY